MNTILFNLLKIHTMISFKIHVMIHFFNSQ